MRGVSERQDDGAPVVEGVVQGEDRRLLSSMLRLRGREGRSDLVDQFSPFPELAGEVEKQLQLSCDVAKTSGGSKGDAVRPLDVGQARIGEILDLGAMTAPVLIHGDR